MPVQIPRAMRLLELTLPTPEENLALDEALLDWVDSGQGEESLRFWEFPRPFVVLGYSDRLATEVNNHACHRMHCPILRRCTGGGTVVQGPGSLSYALVLRITPELGSVSAANKLILARQSRYLSPLLAKTLELKGSTDLVIEGRKCSGNAQRRRRQALLFHGTLLHNIDFNLLEDLLPMPSRQPDYRAHRSHREFLTPLPLPPDLIRNALARAWNAVDPMRALPSEVRLEVGRLVNERYSQAHWTARR